jgi:hypothetical protein
MIRSGHGKVPDGSARDSGSGHKLRETAELWCTERGVTLVALTSDATWFGDDTSYQRLGIRRVR